MCQVWVAHIVGLDPQQRIDWYGKFINGRFFSQSIKSSDSFPIRRRKEGGS